MSSRSKSGETGQNARDGHSANRDVHDTRLNDSAELRKGWYRLDDMNGLDSTSSAEAAKNLSPSANPTSSRTEQDKLDPELALARV